MKKTRVPFLASRDDPCRCPALSVSKDTFVDSNWLTIPMPCERPLDASLSLQGSVHCIIVIYWDSNIF